MGVWIAAEHHQTDIPFLHHRIVGLDLFDTLLAQADIEYFEPSNENLVFGEEEGEFLLSEGERKVSPNDVGPDVISIVLSHQAGGHVDAHHLGLRGVDILHQ